MSGLIRLESDAEYPEAKMDRYAGLVMKCKSLRGRLQSIRTRGATVLGNFSSITEGIKFSGLYRKLHRDNRDTSLPGPPAYFTRRQDGIPVPTLGLFMTGYKNLFKMDIPRKTLENSYLLMNRQVWTSEKSALSGVGGGPGGEYPEDTCKLCRVKENTMHLMFTCEKYSEPLWAVVSDVLKET
jgi:hypothetical protein